MDKITFRYMQLKEVIHLTGLSKTPLYERIKSGDFPSPVTLSKQCVRFRSDEIADWMNRKSESREAGKDERSEKARSAAAKRHAVG